MVRWYCVFCPADIPLESNKDRRKSYILKEQIYGDKRTSHALEIFFCNNLLWFCAKYAIFALIINKLVSNVSTISHKGPSAMGTERRKKTFGFERGQD